MLVGLSPHRDNGVFRVNPKIDVEEFAICLYEDIKAKQSTFPKTMIFVRISLIVPRMNPRKVLYRSSWLY